MKKAYVKPQLIRSAILSNVTAFVGSPKVVDSDIRLKTDIQRVGHAPNGLPLYHFKYVGGDDVYEGVMAQDVLKVFPEAVCRRPNGYLAVRYDMLGLRMTKVH
jgi:hypothetical protein